MMELCTNEHGAKRATRRWAGQLASALAMLVLAIGLPARAQHEGHDHGHDHSDHGHGDHGHGDHAHGDHDHGEKGAEEDPFAGMDPEAMERFKQLAEPGAHHAHLAPLVGDWTIAGRFRPAPDAPWSESISQSKAVWILGKRFVSQHIVGEAVPGFEGKFEGMGLLGYDNLTGKYNSVWIDNMSTITMVGDGGCSSDGKVITFMSKYMSPFTGTETYMKSVYTVESADKYVLRMYEPDPTGKEFLSMELVHTRK